MDQRTTEENPMAKKKDAAPVRVEPVADLVATMSVLRSEVDIIGPAAGGDRFLLRYPTGQEFQVVVYAR
jgi:hypothetical protein